MTRKHMARKYKSSEQKRGTQHTGQWRDKKVVKWVYGIYYRVHWKIPNYALRTNHELPLSEMSNHKRNLCFMNL